MKKHNSLTLDEVMEKIIELGGDPSKIKLSPKIRAWLEEEDDKGEE